VCLRLARQLLKAVEPETLLRSTNANSSFFANCTARNNKASLSLRSTGKAATWLFDLFFAFAVDWLRDGSLCCHLCGFYHRHEHPENDLKIGFAIASDADIVRGVRWAPFMAAVHLRPGRTIIRDANQTSVRPGTISHPFTCAFLSVLSQL
jgi:hypothetical protein